MSPSTLTKWWTHLLTTNKLTKNLNATRRHHFNVNSKILTLKKTDAIATQRYYRLRCSVPQPPKLYGLPKLHKPGIPMRPIVSFCGSPTYQLSKYLTTMLQPLTDKSRRKLQSFTENFIDAVKTVQIPDDYKLLSFDVKSLFTSIPDQLALQCTETTNQQSTVKLPLPTEDIVDLLNLCLTLTYFQCTVNTTNSCMEQPWGRLFLLLSQKLWCNTWRNAPSQMTGRTGLLL